MSDKVSNVALAHNVSKRAIKTKNTDRSTTVFPLFEFLFRANGAPSDSISRVCTQEPLLISKKIIVRLHTLSEHNSLLVHYKVYSPYPRNVCVQAESILKPMKTLVLYQQHVERIL